MIGSPRKSSAHAVSWKQPRTRRRNLPALGADPKHVHMATRSRKGYWRMSQNEIVRLALNNRWSRGTRSSRHGSHLDRSSSPGASSGKLIGTALYNAPDAIASLNKPRSHPAWTEARSQSHTQGGVGPGSQLLPGTRLAFLLSFGRGKSAAPNLHLLQCVFRTAFDA